MNKKVICIILIIILLSSSIGIIFFIDLSDYEKLPDDRPEDIVRIPEFFLLENVKYVPQETSTSCFYASIEMIFSYLGIDMDLEEAMFYSGVGYTLLYQKEDNNLPLPGVFISQLEDIEFLVEIFGINFTYNAWVPEPDDNNQDIIWEKYWTGVKENISKNRPIITSVDPLVLPSVRKQFDIPEKIWDHLLSFFGHSIVLIGYNESNQTVCFNDPAAGYFGNPNYGNYCWMDLNLFRKAVSEKLGRLHLIMSFNETNERITKKDAFEQAIERNLIKLKGINFSSQYLEIFEKISEGEFSLGIEAVKDLREDLNFGLRLRTKTIYSYKTFGMQYKRAKLNLLIDSFKLKIPYQDLESLLLPQQNMFHLLAEDREIVYNYLKNVDYYKDLKTEAELFKKEAELWNDIGSLYEIFLRRGFLLGILRSNVIMIRIARRLNHIIDIQEEIILLHSKRNI